MREIKFRAWDKQDQEMFCPEYLLQDEKDGLLILTSDARTERYILMQSTGLKDNSVDEDNRKEIYAGDRVKATNKNGWTREFEIIWSEDRARFMVWEKSQPNISFDLTCDTIIDYRVVVIGNIYDNPELLGAGEGAGK